ncbi:thiamine diphosphokinase [Aggregatilineales bacterium SYSU G02658]
MTQFLIFANGEPNDGPMVQRALHEGADAHVIAADGGARVARFFGRRPDTLIGDMDSLPAADVERFEREGVRVLRHPAEKNETDLELCLLFAAEHGARWVRIIGGIGTRFDQVLANVLLMTLPALAQCDVELVAGKQSIRLLQAGEHAITGEVGDTVSLIPLAGDVHEIVTEGLRYPLRRETLRFGPARGVSNELAAPAARVAVGAGLLLLVHTQGKAE